MIQKFTGIAAAAFITSLTLTSCGSKVPTMDGSSVSVTGASTEADISSEPDASAISDTVVIVSEEAEQFSINVSIPDNYTIPNSFILEGFNTVL